MKRLAMIGLIFAMFFAIGCNKGGGNNGTSGSNGNNSNISTATIGSNGGSISSADNKVTIQIPAGALAADTTISVATVSENLGQVGSMYQVTAQGIELVFSTPVTLRFSYDPSLLPAGAIEQNSKLAFLGAYDAWEVLSDSAVDTINHVITATTTHFSGIGAIPSYAESAAPKLQFPLASLTPYNAPITSVFDHSMTTTYCPDGKVTAFTGEQGIVMDSNEPSLPALNCSGQRLHSYKKDNVGTPFTVNGHYVGTTATGSGTLNYDGHAGYDYPVAYTDVFSATSGTVRVWKESTCWNSNGTAKNTNGCIGRIDILYDNVYETRYIHMSQTFVTTGQFVGKGVRIGVSGITGAASPHLHFEVRKNDTTPIDPYGWTGTGADPYTKAINENLWITTLASGLNWPSAIATDSENIYWLEWATQYFGNDGTLKKISTNGGGITTLALGLSDPSGIAIDSSNIYWIEWWGHTVKKINKNGGGITTLASGLSSPQDIAVDSTNVYWTEDCSNAVRKISIDGGAITTLASGDCPYGGVYRTSIATDSNNVYWVEFTSNSNGVLKKVGKNGGVITTLASGLMSPYDIAVDSNNIYWVEAQGAVKKINLNDNNVTTLAPNSSNCCAVTYSIAIDSNNVYWSDVSSNTIKKTSLSGGTIIPAASSSNGPTYITIDPINIYWLESGSLPGSNGTIKKISK